MIAETQLKYNGQRIIPAPLVTYGGDDTNTTDGEKLSRLITITARGTLVAWKGSPDSSGVFWTGDGYPPDEFVDESERLGAILRKKDAMQKLFSENYKLLSIQSADGSNPTYCNPKIRSFNFDEGPWFDRCDYEVVFEVDRMYATLSELQDNTGNSYINSASETWNLTPGDAPGTFNLEHALTAEGRGVVTTGGVLIQSGWQSAKIWCSGRMGFDANIVNSSFLMASGLNGWNPTRTEDLNEVDGSYTINENWILAPTSAIETYNGAWNIVFDDAFSTVNVSVRGNVRGLYSGLNNQSQQLPNASSYFFNNVLSNGYARASSIFPSTILNTNPTNKSIDYDYQNGTLQYELAYNDAPFVSGTQEEYTVEVVRNQDPFINVTINGTIFGRLLDGEHTIPTKFSRATDMWAIVEPQLFSRVSGYVSGLQSFPLSKNVSRNPIQGTIQYTAEYNNRDDNGYTNVYTASLRFDQSSGRKSVAVNGQVVGNATTEIGGWTNRWANAQSGWIVVKSGIPGIASSVLATIKDKALAVSIDENPKEGTISYAYEFNDRPNKHWIDEFTINFTTTRREGVSNCTVAGNIIGLMDETEDGDDKYAWATSGFKAVSGDFYSRASGFIATFYPSVTGLTTLPVTVNIGSSPVAGTISYNYEYDTVPLPTITGVLSQQVSIQDTWARDVFVAFPVPLNDGGPSIIQDMDSITEKRRSGTVSLILPIGSPKPNRTQVDALIPSPTTGVKYIDENTEVWSSSTGQYTRTLAWVYATTGYYE